MQGQSDGSRIALQPKISFLRSSTVSFGLLNKLEGVEADMKKSPLSLLLLTTASFCFVGSKPLLASIRCDIHYNGSQFFCVNSSTEDRQVEISLRTDEAIWFDVNRVFHFCTLASSRSTQTRRFLLRPNEPSLRIPLSPEYSETGCSELYIINCEKEDAVGTPINCPDYLEVR